MHLEFSDQESRVLQPTLREKPRGVPREDDRRILDGIFQVLRSDAPRRDLPESLGPLAACDTRFVRW